MVGRFDLPATRVRLYDLQNFKGSRVQLAPRAVLDIPAVLLLYPVQVVADWPEISLL
jgi:hypothetical protein